MMIWNDYYTNERGFNMFEKVNPSHPDKVADRIAGAIVDLAYQVQENPKVAVEVPGIISVRSLPSEVWKYSILPM